MYQGFYSATVSHCFRPEAVSFTLCYVRIRILMPSLCFLSPVSFSLCHDHYFLPLISFLCFFTSSFLSIQCFSLLCHKQCFLYHVSFHLFLFSTVCLCILCVLLSLKHFHPFHCFFIILCFHDKCFILTCFNLTVSFSLVCFPIYHNYCFVPFASFSQFLFCFMLHW